MANTPRKMKDPTEAALSAIQDALNLRDAPATAPQRPNETPAADKLTDDHVDFGPRTRPPAMDEDLSREDVQLPLPGGEARSRRPPNDARQSVGQILQALQQRPSRAPYVFAFLFSI